ncbi:MAG: immune inhibitor A, partial [Anaerolineales bacterium]|nr:immune inhibitor A [Anaerolineales bacterium]
FRDRFGEAATQALVRHPEGSMAGVAAVLADVAPDMTPDALFADWLAASYLQGIGRGTGVYRYNTVSLPPLATTDVGRLPAAGSATVSQYGADYLRIRGAAPVTAVFTGTQQVPAFGAPAHSGQLAWVSYPADKSAMHLTRAFDLRGLDQATLTFWTWYAIEEGWDYAYLAVSADDGRSWQLLETPSTTAANPQGNSFGPGYTGISGGGDSPVWQQETADLTPFAGQEILLRFHAITDGALTGQGFLVDDIAVPELAYQDDAEQPGQWTESGMLRVTNTLPQSFIVQRVLVGFEGIQIERLPLDENQRGEWIFPMDRNHSEAILMVSGSTPVTRQPAPYQLAIIPEKE